VPQPPLIAECISMRLALYVLEVLSTTIVYVICINLE